MLIICVFFGCTKFAFKSNDLKTRDLGTSLSEFDIDKQDSDLALANLSKNDQESIAGYYFLVAEYLNLKGDFVVANELYESAYELDSNQYLAEKYLSSELKINKFDEAKNIAKKMSLQYPKSSEIHFLLAEIYNKEQNFEDAVQAIKKTLKLDPKSIDAHLFLISLYESAGQKNQALLAAKNMSVHMPYSSTAWSILSKIYLQHKQAKNALKTAQKAYKLSPENNRTMINYALLLDRFQKKSQANELFKEYFKDSLKLPEIRNKAVQFIRAIGDLNDADQKLDELGKSHLFKNSLSIAIHRILIQWKKKNYLEVENILQTAKKEYSELPLLHFMEAVNFEHTKHIDQAIASYQLVAKNSDYYLSSQLKITELYRSHNQPKLALSIIKELLKSKYASWDLYIIAANILNDQNDFKAAVDILDHGYTIYKTKTRLLFLRGVYEEKDGDLDQCILTMKEVISKDPNYGSAYNYLGYLYAENNIHLEEAKELLHQALRLEPNNGYYLDSLGWIYYQQGLYDQALEILQQSEEILPEESIVLEHIGDTYDKLSNLKKAQEYYQKALQEVEEPEDKKRVQQKIKDSLSS